jgi:hypothetical protein
MLLKHTGDIISLLSSLFFSSSSSLFLHANIHLIIDKILPWYCLLGCDTMYSATSLPPFQKDVLPPSSGPKSKPSSKTLLAACLAYYTTNMFLRNIDKRARIHGSTYKKIVALFLIVTTVRSSNLTRYYRSFMLNYYWHSDVNIRSTC